MQRNKKVISKTPVFILLMFISVFSYGLGWNGSNNSTDETISPYYSCGIFKGPLISYDTIQGNGHPKICGSKSLYTDVLNDMDITCSVDTACSLNTTCQKENPPINKYYPILLESSKNVNIPEDLNFIQKDYENYNFDNNNLVLNFDPENSYSDSSTKYSTFGAWTFENDNVALNFKPGDYFFDSLEFDGNNVHINVLNDGPVRIFVKENLQFYKNNVFINNNGDENNLFIYVGGNLEFKNVDENSIKVNAFAYVKGNVEFKPNSNNFIWYGGITAEGDITIDSNNAHFIYRGINNNLGYGKCHLCYALNHNGSLIGFSQFMNMQFNFPRDMGIINNSNETLQDVNVSQIEDTSGFSGTGACYNLIDKNGNNTNKPIYIDYNGIGWIIGDCVMGGLGDTNTTAEIGSYPAGGFNNYYMIRTFGISGQFIGNEDLKYYANYLDNENRKYSVKLDYCQITNGLYNGVTGPFDAWDTFRNIHDRNISTKIVNQDFNLTIASINCANDATEAKEGIDMQYQLYDMAQDTNLTPWQDYNASSQSDGASAIKTFNINRASKRVKVRFKFCALDTGNGLELASLSTCILGSNEYNSSYEINTSTFSSDNFAVRPFAFKIFGNNQYKRAGEDFNLTVKAVDKNNYNIATGTIYNISSVINYNEPASHLKITSHFYTPSTSDIHQMQIDTGQSNVTTCPYSGSFTVNNTNFFNGETNATLNFSETGILDINISEKAGYEFAKVDEDDTNNSQRYIKPAIKIYDQNDISKTNILLFVPYSFTTTAQYNTTNQKNWVYMADINNSNISFTAPKMAAYVFYTIKAYNKFGNLTKNFTKTCFPDVSVNCPTVNGLKLNATFDLFLDLDINSTKDANITLYSETNTSTPIYTPNKNISILQGKNSLQEWISPKQFESGVGQAKVYLNIDRNISTSLNPIIINVQDANTSTSWMANPGSPVAFNGIFLNSNKTFFYGRVHAPDYSAENNTTIKNAKIYYEVYCKDCGKSQYPSLGKESVDGVYWYINTAQDNSKDGNISGFPNFLNTTPSGLLTITQNSISNGVENYTITYIGSSYPYKEKIDINTSSWLIYNPYNPNATTNSFYVDFSGVGSWAGIGKTGHTIDLNISTRRSKRIEW